MEADRAPHECAAVGGLAVRLPVLLGPGCFASLYGLASVGIILVIPKAHLSRVSGFADAYKVVSSDLHSRPLGVVFGS